MDRKRDAIQINPRPHFLGLAGSACGLMLIMLLSGCQHQMFQSACLPCEQDPPPATFHGNPNPSSSSPVRIVIVTTKPQNSYQLQTQFATHLADHIKQHNRIHAVVHDRPCLQLPQNVIQSGKFDPVQLVQLGKMYSADAVLYVEVSHFQAYQPLQATTSLALIDVKESVVLRCGNLRRSTEDKSVLNAFSRFTSRRPDVDPEILTHSPNAFLSFLAADIAGALHSSLR